MPVREADIDLHDIEEARLRRESARGEIGADVEAQFVAPGAERPRREKRSPGTAVG